MSPRLSDQQLADRRGHLGASDIAVIAGVSPWKTPFELYLEKIGELDPEARTSDADKSRQERGHRLEDVALDWDAEIRGLSIERIRRDIVHPRLPFVVVHPDARVKPWTKSKRLIEAKTSARHWDAIPLHVEAQVQAQMAATGANACDVVVLGFDGPPVPMEVLRNDELIAALEELATSFWDRVQRHDPPPLDASTAASRYLDRMWTDAPPLVADADQRALLARLLDVRAEAKRLEAEDGNLVIALKQSMAGASRLEARGVGSVLWTPPFERRTTSWKGIAEGLLAQLTPEEREALIAERTTTERDVRQFRPTPWKVQEENAA
jgi:putative phage-type endonuclease